MLVCDYAHYLKLKRSLLFLLSKKKIEKDVSAARRKKVAWATIKVATATDLESKAGFCLPKNMRERESSRAVTGRRGVVGSQEIFFFCILLHFKKKSLAQIPHLAQSQCSIQFSEQSVQCLA